MYVYVDWKFQKWIDSQLEITPPWITSYNFYNYEQYVALVYCVRDYPVTTIMWRETLV